MNVCSPKKSSQQRTKENKPLLPELSVAFTPVEFGRTSFHGDRQ
jgi:hypothetical protein